MHCRTRRFQDGCPAYKNRGEAVCSNHLLAPMEQTERAVLARPERVLFDPTVIDAAWGRMLTEVKQGGCDKTDVQRRQLADVERQIDNLARAIEQTGGSEVLLRRLTDKEQERRSLSEKIAAGPLRLRDGVLAVLKAALEDWREMLRSDPAEVRIRLRQSITGRINFAPKDDEKGRRYEFSGVGSLEPVLAGILPASLASPIRCTPVGPGDSNGRDRPL